MERLSPRDRRSALIVERLETIAASRESGEAASIRGFLRTWRKVTEGGNPAGFTLRVRVVAKQPNHAIVFAEGVVVGRVRWMPVLVVPMSDHFTRIMRECGDLPRLSYDRVKATDVWGQIEPKKPPMLAKVNIELLQIH